jgi:hypothetical protein
VRCGVSNFNFRKWGLEEQTKAAFWQFSMLCYARASLFRWKPKWAARRVCSSSEKTVSTPDKDSR